jgi:hypothetical protein
MHSRRLLQLAVAGAVAAAGVAFAGPVSASVVYDRETRTGFVGGDDVAKVFGWTDAVLVARASGVTFDQTTWTNDTYSVACGKAAFPWVHHRVFGRDFLTGAADRDWQRGRGGYRGALVGFRIAGAHSGISGTTVPPVIGGACPQEQGQTPGSTVNEIRLVSSTTGWALNVESDDVSHLLLMSETTQGSAATNPSRLSSMSTWPAAGTTRTSQPAARSGARSSPESSPLM